MKTATARFVAYKFIKTCVIQEYLDSRLPSLFYNNRKHSVFR